MVLFDDDFDHVVFISFLEECIVDSERFAEFEEDLVNRIVRDSFVLRVIVDVK